MQHPLAGIIEDLTRKDEIESYMGNEVEVKPPSSKWGPALLWGGLGLATYFLLKSDNKIKSNPQKNPEDDFLKEKNYEVPEHLLNKYIYLCFNMEKNRNLEDAREYGKLDTEKRDLHNQILECANVTREDKDFAFWLAIKTDRCLEKLRGNRIEYQNPIVPQESNPFSAEQYVERMFIPIINFKILLDDELSVDIREGFFLKYKIAFINGCSTIIRLARRTDRIEYLIKLFRFRVALMNYRRYLGKISYNKIHKPGYVLEDLILPMDDNKEISLKDILKKNIKIITEGIKTLDLKREHIRSLVGHTGRTDYNEIIAASDNWKESEQACTDLLTLENNINDSLTHYCDLMINANVPSMLAINWQNKPITDLLIELETLEEEYKATDQKTKALESASDEVFIDMGDWKWIVADSREEAELMSHCGREHEGMVLLSLRHYDKKKKTISAHVSVAMYWLEDQYAYVTQMKGRGNNKPNKKYHPYIITLLKDERIQAKLLGAYRPENDFSIDDLTPEEKADLLSAKPQLESVEAFNKINGGEITLKLLSRILPSISSDTVIENDSIIFDSWDDEYSFVAAIDSYLPSNESSKIKQAWNWLDQIHDLGYYASWKQSQNDIDDLIKTLEDKKPKIYLEVMEYLAKKYPEAKTLKEGLVAINERPGSEDLELIEAFTRAIDSGFDSGFRSNANKNFLEALKDMEWNSGAYIAIKNSPFRIMLCLDLSDLDDLINGKLELDNPDDLLNDISSGFDMRDTEMDYDEVAAYEYLSDSLLPEALHSAKKSNPKKKTIRLSKKALLQEHKHLIKVLRKGKRKQLLSEAKKQEKELDEYGG